MTAKTASDAAMNFNELVLEMGEAGEQMTHLRAAEGSAGNISVFCRELTGLSQTFTDQGELALPVPCPDLAGGWVVVTGTGRRLRDIARRPDRVLCALRILPGGARASLWAAAGVRPTSEFNSHLAIHQDQAARHSGSRGLVCHAVLHAQPPALTYLSHISAYAETEAFNRSISRWEPETVLIFPEGIGMIPFQVPGSPEQMEATVAGLRAYQAVVWQRHGIVTRSDKGVLHAADLVEYAETAAEYELMNLRLGEPSAGISPDNIKRIKSYYGHP